MLQLSRMADYGVRVLSHMLRSEKDLHTAPALAAETGLGEATVSKLLKQLTRQNILCSSRGVNGGYCLARPATEISISEVIEAVDGPIALTRCVDHPEKTDCGCPHQGSCDLKANWQKMNDAVKGAMAQVSLADLLEKTA